MADVEGKSFESSAEALSVSAAMALAKGALEGVCVRIIGEVSELSNKPGYKAVYFTIKDESASLPCMIWNNRYASCGVELRVGMLVEISGRFSLYAAKGRMNFDVFTITLSGEGMLRMQVADLARKLQAEGLMSVERKRALPIFPQVIGLVTSPRGAAMHDVLRTLRRRYPLARVLLAGVPVEGAQAAQNIIEGIRCVIDAQAEVVLVVRGGGSFEDLMPFNDENLARMIAGAEVPIITGIGHEPDTSIADMVADMRASTPTAAAEAVAPDMSSLISRMSALASSMKHLITSHITTAQREVDRIANTPLFTEPSRLYANEAQTLDDLSTRLNRAIPQSFEKNKQNLALFAHSLESIALTITLREKNNVASMRERFRLQGQTLTQRFSTQVGIAAAGLDNLSPIAVVSRGYAIAADEQRDIVKSIDSVNKGDSLHVLVADGAISCNVVDKRKMENAMEFWEET